MKVCFYSINVDPRQPALRFGPGERQLLAVKDELRCRILGFEAGSHRYYHVCCPFADVTIGTTREIHRELEQLTGQRFDLTLCTTHTHYSVEINRDPAYRRYFTACLAAALSDLKFQEYADLNCTFVYRHFDKVGQCRISGQTAENVFLEAFCLYSGERRIATILTYNSHPTTLNFFEDYFTAAGPGLLLHDLEQRFPDEFFTYMIGAAGDVSTRFTRTGQTYRDMQQMNRLVEEEVMRLLQTPAKHTPVPAFHIENHWLGIRRQLRHWDDDEIPKNLTPREVETLQDARNRKISLAGKPSTVLFQRLTLGDHHFILAPFELFSEYISYTDKEHSTLANCCNDHDSYLSGLLPQRMTFEIIGESIPPDSKIDIINLLKRWSGKS